MTHVTSPTCAIATLDTGGERFHVGVSVVLPAFNEEAIIERTVRHVAHVLAPLVDEFEVIVTDRIG